MSLVLLQFDKLCWLITFGGLPFLKEKRMSESGGEKGGKLGREEGGWKLWSGYNERRGKGRIGAVPPPTETGEAMLLK